MAQTAARSKTVETKTIEEIPVSTEENNGLGMPCLAYLDSVPDEELPIITVRLYRLEPKGSEGYIDKLCPAERIDEEWIKARHGGGLFAISLKNKNGKSGYDRSIRIEGPPKSPAAAPAATLAAAPDNMGRLCDLLERVVMERNAPPAAPVPSPAQESAVAVMAQAAGEAVKLVSAQIKQPEAPATSPLQEKLLNAAIDRLLAPPPAPAAPPQNALLDKLLQTAIDRLLAPPPAPGTAGGLLSEVTQLTQLITAIDTLRGGGGGAGMDWKSALVQQFGEHIPDIVGGANAIMDKRLAELRLKAETAIRLRGGPVPPGAPPAASTVPPAASAPAPSLAPPVAAAPAPASPTPSGALSVVRPGEEAPRGPSAEPLQTSAIPPAPVNGAAPASLAGETLLRFAKERIRAMFEEGAHGAQIVVMLAGIGQNDLVDMLGKYSSAQVIGYLKADPILGETVADEDFPEVIAEAQEYIRQAKAAGAAAPAVQ